MQSTQIQVKHLKAALICAAKNDVRYYLNSVLVEVRKRDTLLVSTDGHRLAVIRTHVVPDGEPEQTPAQILIPRDSLKGVRAAKGAVACVLTYEGDPLLPLAECRLSPLADAGKVFMPIDGKFPDWRSVMPDKVTGELGEGAAFDPYYVADFTDLVRCVAGADRVYVTLAPNGWGCALVGCLAVPEFIGALMPMRGTVDEITRPDWI